MEAAQEAAAAHDARQHAESLAYERARAAAQKEQEEREREQQKIAEAEAEAEARAKALQAEAEQAEVARAEAEKAEAERAEAARAEEQRKAQEQKAAKEAAAKAEAEKRKKTSKSEESVAERAQHSGTTSLNDRFAKSALKFGLNDRIGFVRDLFDGRQEDFNRVVSQLNSLSTLEEAQLFLAEHVAPDYNWEKHEETAERFLAAVEQRFS